MGPIETSALGLVIVGCIFAFIGWFSVLRHWYEEGAIVMCLIGFSMGLVTWIASAIHYREMKGAFWFQTIGAFLIAGGVWLKSTAI